MKNQFDGKIWLAIALIAIGALSRLIQLPGNFAAIGAVALFGGAYIGSRNLAVIIPLTALFITDLVIGLHPDLFAVYFSYVLIVTIGMYLRKNPGVVNTLAASLVSSVLFFLITNFSVWVTGTLYPKTFDGLVQCYTLAIPFFRNTFAGDLIFTAALFGTYELAKRFVFKPAVQ